MAPGNAPFLDGAINGVQAREDDRHTAQSEYQFIHQSLQLLVQQQGQLKQQQEQQREANDALLRHYRLIDVRPKQPWNGDSDVLLFLKNFREQVEELPGITDREIWFELMFWTTGQARELLSPCEWLDCTEAIRQSKEALKEVWGNRWRVQDELERDAIFGGGQVPKDDHLALVLLRSKLQTIYNRAKMHNLTEVLDEPNFVIAVCLARAEVYQEQWKEHAMEMEDGTVNFISFIDFLRLTAKRMLYPTGPHGWKRVARLLEQRRGSDASNTIEDDDEDEE